MTIYKPFTLWMTKLPLHRRNDNPTTRADDYHLACLLPKEFWHNKLHNLNLSMNWKKKWQDPRSREKTRLLVEGWIPLKVAWWAEHNLMFLFPHLMTKKPLIFQMISFHKTFFKRINKNLKRINKNLLVPYLQEKQTDSIVTVLWADLRTLG